VIQLNPVLALVVEEGGHSVLQKVSGAGLFDILFLFLAYVLQGCWRYMT
jgi:hypothetical protein